MIIRNRTFNLWNRLFGCIFISFLLTPIKRLHFYSTIIKCKWNPLDPIKKLILRGTFWLKSKLFVVFRTLFSLLSLILDPSLVLSQNTLMKVKKQINNFMINHFLEKSTYLQKWDCWLAWRTRLTKQKTFYSHSRVLTQCDQQTTRPLYVK